MIFFLRMNPWLYNHACSEKPIRISLFATFVHEKGPHVGHTVKENGIYLYLFAHDNSLDCDIPELL